MSKKKIRDKQDKRRRKRKVDQLSQKRIDKNKLKIEKALHEIQKEEKNIHEVVKSRPKETRESLRKNFFKTGLLLCPQTGLMLTKVRITDMSATGFGFWSGKKISRQGYTLMYYLAKDHPVKIPIKIHWREKGDLVYTYGAEMVL